MNSRREIPLQEMRGMIDVMSAVAFNVEHLPVEDQSRLASALFFLMKANSGLDSNGNPTNRYGRYEDNCEVFHRRVAACILKVSHGNPTWRSNHMRQIKIDVRGFNLNSLITSRNPESNKAGLNLAMSLLRNSWQVLPMDITAIESTQKIIFAVLLSNLAKEIDILSVNMKHRPPETRTDSKLAKGDIATINQKLEIMQGKIDRLD